MVTIKGKAVDFADFLVVFMSPGRKSGAFYLSRIKVADKLPKIAYFLIYFSPIRAVTDFDGDISPESVRVIPRSLEPSSRESSSPWISRGISP